MFEDSSNFAIALQFFTVVLATRWLLKSKATAAKKLNVDYGGDVSLPLPLKIIASLPDSIRIPLLVKLAKPSPPKDSIDILGTKEVDPYKKREILPGKIWGVKYTCITDPELGKFLEMFMEGTKEERKAAAIQNAPDHLRAILKEDFDRKQKYDALSDVEKAKLGGDSCQEMFVIKINADDLLLYNPVRMHLEMIDWINQRGQVKYIVSGSSAHTNHLPGTAAAFPNAIIICASAADAKCQAVGMRPADYLYDLHEDEPLPKSYLHRGTMKHATDALNGQAKLFHVRGDVMTQSLLLLAHGHLFEVDLVYSSSDETKRESNFETGSSIIHSGHRLFTHAFVSEKVKVR
ncbi:hypothetical protein HJC23_005300 [Cyclotella cryptica]|uniref:Uncharacterized protein n=1 Tax=Cyclotella cryptica TaxID=29204 RepID=A0ABD3PG99_9STRA